MTGPRNALLLLPGSIATVVVVLSLFGWFRSTRVWKESFWCRRDIVAASRLNKNLFVGVSGFSYPSWKGTFYPNDLKGENFLTYYSARLQSVEINSSFYAMPKAVVVEGWAQRTRESFRFSFKAPQLVTHILKLGKGSSDAAGRFAKIVQSLGPRRGPILFQLPPYSKFDIDLLGDFLAETSDIEDRVFEFRHESWFQEQTYRLLESNGTGFCIAETDDLEPVLKVTGDLAYFRLRKGSYDEKSVDRWAARIRDAAKGARETYVYLRHDETGENAGLAGRLFVTLEGSGDAGRSTTSGQKRLSAGGRMSHMRARVP